LDTPTDTTPGYSQSIPESSPRPTPEQFRAKGLCGVERFKDAVCGYQGPEQWCDRSRERCTQLCNQERFDGVMPPLKEPWEAPWLDWICALVLFGTLLWSPSWWIAGPLYAIFILLLLPPVREEIYWICERRRVAANQYYGPQPKDN